MSCILEHSPTIVMTDSNPLRILHICKVFLPVKGGVQKVVDIITSSLSSFTHTIITSGEDGAIAKEKTNETHIFRCRSYAQIASMPIAPSLIPKIFNHVQKHQLIALHYPYPLAELALLLSYNTPPIVVHWHSEVIAQKKLKWLVMPLTFLTLIRAKAIVVTSHKMVKPSFFLKKFANKTVFIPYGVEAAPPKLIEQKPDIEQPYFIILGRHVSYKGIDIAIEALNEVPGRLIIAGYGPLYEKHKKLATDLKVLDRIEFNPYATDVEVLTLIRGCLALVVPSVMENEAFALVQLEAMRLAKPVINTSLKSSVPWVARHQQEALTVSKGDVKALAGAMNLLRSDPALAQRLGENGLKRYQKEFTSDRFSTALTSLYSKILSNHKASSAP